MATKPFASSDDLAPKTETLVELADGVLALTAEGDPNVGCVIGDDTVLAFEARATPVMAQPWVDRVRERTDLPFGYLFLSHYHAVRTLGAAAFDADVVISSEGTAHLIEERGQQDWDSEYGRMPRLFGGHESIPGLTRPDQTFADKEVLDLGGRTVELIHLGRGHTAGDAVLWLPEEKILFAGDLVESHAALYTGDAFHDEWRTTTLDAVAALGAETVVGGRGPVAEGAEAVEAAIAQTRNFLDVLRGEVAEVHGRSGTLTEAFEAAHGALVERYGHWPIFEHCMPFNVQRVWDELDGVDWPRIWTAERDREVWDELQS